MLTDRNLAALEADLRRLSTPIFSTTYTAVATPSDVDSLGSHSHFVSGLIRKYVLPAAADALIGKGNDWRLLITDELDEETLTVRIHFTIMPA